MRRPPPTDLQRRTAAALLDVFRPRADVYARRMDDPAAVDSFNAWRADHAIPCAPAKLGNYRPAGKKGRRSALTADALLAHVTGRETLGVYPLRPDGTCNSVGVDFDNHRGEQVVAADPRADYDAVAAVCDRRGVPYLGWHSRGGAGYWIQLLPPEATPARDARAVLHGILAEAGVRPITEGGTFDALFPKQDQAEAISDDPTARPGNLFCLPLNGRWLTEDAPGTHFVGFAPGDLDAQLRHLEAAQRIAPPAWATLVALYPPPAPKRAPPRARAEREASGPTAPPAWQASAWELALRRAGRLGSEIGAGKFAVLCINDAAHSDPAGSTGRLDGSTVLFPPSDERNLGYPHCSHAHCADLTLQEWIEAVGRDTWEEACIAARGWKRADVYLLHDGGLSLWRRTAAGPDDGGVLGIEPDEELTNFGARIIANVVESDGVEDRRFFDIEARIGKHVRVVRVPAKDFGSMGWVASQLGANAVIRAGRDTRDRAREAIQLVSMPIPQRQVFAVVGWQRIRNRWAYVHAGGAIGVDGAIDGVELVLPPEAQRFRLPAPPRGEDLVEAVQACAGLFGLEAGDVAVPLFAAPWRAALGPCPVTLHLSAEQNLGKTLLASLAQQHFGAEMDGEHPPLTWRSTMNALNKVRSIVGDACVLIDDFLVKGTADDLKMGDKFDAVVRHQFSGAGTSRLNRDSSLRNEPPARGLLLTTGEVLPRGHSMRSRVVSLHLAARITRPLDGLKAEGRAGLYASAMAGYVRWLAPQLDAVRAALPAALERAAAAIGGSDSDRRTVQLLAHLLVGVEHFLAFAQDAGALAADDAAAVHGYAVGIFRGHVESQARQQGEQDQAVRFLECVGMAITSGRGHILSDDGKTAPQPPTVWGWRTTSDGRPPLTPYDGPRWASSGPCLGYTDGEFVWLNRSVAMAEARRVAEGTGDPLSILDAEDLARRLYRRGLLARTEIEKRGTLVVRKTVGGKTLSGYLCVKAESLGLSASDDARSGPSASGPSDPGSADGQEQSRYDSAN